MRWLERQQQVETAIYDVIDELSDQLSITVSSYPKVWWMGRTVKFQDMGLPSYLKEELEIRNSKGISYYIVSHKTVIIAKKSTQHAILEEASHAFHFISSGVSYKNRKTKDLQCLAVLVEMFGLLGARLIGSDFENPYENFPDLASLTKESQKEVKKIILKKIGENCDFNEFFIHQQGYGLADRIYFKYLSGEVSLSR
ncbi:MAG: hypothetical protein AAB969_00815, partial [Patescibacteria group bacterium]